MLRQKCLKFRSPEMPFTEANSGQVVIFQRFIPLSTDNSPNVQVCISASIMVIFLPGGNCSPCSAGYGHGHVTTDWPS